MFHASESFSEDPGVPDTVRFGEWSVYVTGPPYAGEAIVPLVVFNDEPVQLFHIPVKWTGPMVCDTAYYAEGRPDVLDYQAVDIETSIPLVWFVALSHGDPMPPGTGTVAHMHFVVYDTGWAELDTANTGIIYLVFNDPQANSWIPQVVPRRHHIIPSLPGDVNGDGKVDASDVVFLINYLYRGGTVPDPPQRGDVNGDSVVGAGDVVYLINYLYRSGPPPLARHASQESKCRGWPQPGPLEYECQTHCVLHSLPSAPDRQDRSCRKKERRILHTDTDVSRGVKTPSPAE